MLKKLALFSFLSFPSIAFSALSKTYPTAATTQIRWTTYGDSIQTIYYSTWTITLSTWTELGGTVTYLDSPLQFDPVTRSPFIRGFIMTREFADATSSTRTWFVSYATWSLKAYTDLVVDQTKRRMIFDIAHKDMEQYMVWGDTDVAHFNASNWPPKEGWDGWCFSIASNGNRFYVECPK